MPIFIDKVRVCNFRSLSKCEVELSPVTLLIGANNSGKTSFLRALNLALGVGMRRVMREDFFIEREEPFDIEKAIIIDVRLVPVDENNTRVNNFDDIWREQFGELISFDETDREFFAFRTKVVPDILRGDYIVRRYKIKEWKEESTWEQQQHLEDLKISFDGFPLFFIDAQRDIIQDLRDRSSYFGRLVSKVKVDKLLLEEIEGKIKKINEDIVAGSDELDFLKQELEKLKNTIGTENIIEISPVHKKLRDINRGININLQDSGSESFPLDYHGMGTRSWASLLTFGAFISWQYKKSEADGQPYHTLLALEEPEAHLHPHAQRTLYRQLSEMHGQKIISTHSPFIAAQCQLDELRHFKKQESSTEIRILDSASLSPEDKRKLRREVLNTRGEILFARAIVLFEGETEEQFLPILAEAYWHKHPYELGISFVGVGGHNYKPFLQLLSAFHLTGFVLSDGEDNVLKNVKKQIDEVFASNAKTFKDNNLVAIPGKCNMERYLINTGLTEQIMKAVELIEGEGYVKNFIRIHHGKSKGSKKTDKTCDKCKQAIYEDIIRDYGNDEGLKSAILDIISKGKTKYAAKIAEEIAKGTLPEIVSDLFKKIDGPIIGEKK